jgi:hypothetical protein
VKWAENRSILKNEWNFCVEKAELHKYLIAAAGAITALRHHTRNLDSGFQINRHPERHYTETGHAYGSMFEDSPSACSLLRGPALHDHVKS